MNVFGSMGQERIKSRTNQYSVRETFMKEGLRPPLFDTEDEMELPATLLPGSDAAVYRIWGKDGEAGVAPPTPDSDLERMKAIRGQTRVIRTADDIGSLRETPEMKKAMERLSLGQITDIVDWFLGLGGISRLGLIAGGVGLIVVGNMNLVRGTFGSSLLRGGGGILIGLGVLPYLIDLF